MPSLTLQTVAVPHRHVTLDQIGVDPKQAFRPPPPIMEPEQSHGTTQERRQWLKEWCLANPNETIRGAQAALAEHFDRGLGNAAVISIVNEARAELDRARSAEKLPDGTDNAIKVMASLVATRVEFTVSYSPDGQLLIAIKP